MSLPRVLKARAKHSATMIFLHGLGDTGHGWAEAFNEIRPDYLKIVCPNAPSMPVTLNRGMVMPAWYDLWQVSKVLAHAFMPYQNITIIRVFFIFEFWRLLADLVPLFRFGHG